MGDIFKIKMTTNKVLHEDCLLDILNHSLKRRSKTPILQISDDENHKFYIYKCQACDGQFIFHEEFDMNSDWNHSYILKSNEAIDKIKSIKNIEFVGLLIGDEVKRIL